MCYFQEPDDVVNNALVRRDQCSRQHGRSAALQTRNRVAGRTNQLQFFPTLCNHHGMKRLLPVLCLFAMWVAPANGEQFDGTWTGKITFFHVIVF
mgnify:CR=1 FL=1